MFCLMPEVRTKSAESAGRVWALALGIPAVFATAGCPSRQQVESTAGAVAMTDLATATAEVVLFDVEAGAIAYQLGGDSARIRYRLGLVGDTVGYVVLGAFEPGLPEVSAARMIARAELRGSLLTLRPAPGFEAGTPGGVFANAATPDGFVTLESAGGGEIAIRLSSGSLTYALARDTLPWPLPTPTWRFALPRQLLGLDTPGSTLGSAHTRLATALRRAQFASWSTYAVGSDGFAVVTPMESITAEGKALEGGARWISDRLPPSEGDSWLERYLRALVTARAGRYRILLFLLTPRTIRLADAAMEAKEGQGLLLGGDSRFRAEIARRPLTSNHQLAVLIYEFRRAGEGGPAVFLRQSEVIPAKHLSGAGLWSEEEISR